MPAAFYEFNVEQSSDYLAGLRLLKPEDGSLFKFLPNAGQTFWSNNSLNFDVPNEIKLLYPNDVQSFGYLNNTLSDTGNPPNTVPGEQKFLQIRMKIKSSTANTVIEAVTDCYRLGRSVNGDFVKFVPKTTPSSGIKLAFFNFPRTSDAQNNIILHIPNDTTAAVRGKYLYDIELEYKIGNGLTTFVIRPLQGKMTFNPNITT